MPIQVSVGVLAQLNVMKSFQIESSAGARLAPTSGIPEPALFCPVDCGPPHLEIIPAEVLERDCNCGDPGRKDTTGEMLQVAHRSSAMTVPADEGEPQDAFSFRECCRGGKDCGVH